jgi:DNA invertase Pin-like site-specific DNA recombinase
MCEKYWETFLKPQGVGMAGWFYDPAVSSSIFMGERTVGRIVIASLQPGDHLVCAKYSRTFRRLRDGTNTLEMLTLRGVSVHAVDLPVDDKKASGRMVRNMNLVADEYQREIASEHQLEIIAYRKSQGLPHSRGIPVGWKVIGEKPHRQYRADIPERALAQRMYDLHQAGWSMERIALWCLRQVEFPNKRKFDNRQAVRWVITAVENKFPRITNHKEIRKLKSIGKLL